MTQPEGDPAEPDDQDDGQPGDRARDDDARSTIQPHELPADDAGDYEPI